jgi:dephospho-CoA kinase
MMVVGLVGRAGSGKTSFGRALVERGAALIEADRIGNHITDRDAEVRGALVAEYGPEVYQPDGTLDRAKVAERVFSDAQARARLDALVHPKLVRAIRDELAGLRAGGRTALAVVDAALMFSWGLERDCDVVVAIVASEASQVERLARGRGWSAEHARRRLAAQRTNEEFATRADVVVRNEGTLEALRARAFELCDEWTRAVRGPGGNR